MFALSGNEERFRLHLRDLLLQVKEFTRDPESNADLFLDEQRKEQARLQAAEEARINSIPGLAKNEV
jgi:hypothetical protein